VRLTAEFEMGSGSGHTAQTTRPAQDKVFGKQGEAVRRRGLLCVGAVVSGRPLGSGDRFTVANMDHESDQARSSD
jgi:hypothetical protein